MDRALMLAPEDGQTHANRGWLALRRGERALALAHLREALRLDPESEAARQGLSRRTGQLLPTPT
ncbi:MAG: tetratricopeptide repeat protein [Chloroflexota bacterium]|nr:tetratricopeptide repeat protein [Chloroflexota bacterium]